MPRLPRLLLLILLVMSCGVSLPAAEPRWRQPFAAAWLGEQCVVANRRSGSLTIVDVAQNKVGVEVDVAKQLSDLIALPKQRLLLATDEARHQLLAITEQQGDWQVSTKLAVSPYPVSISAHGDGRRAYVAALWSRTLQTVAITPASATAPPQLKITASLELPFPPRQQLLLPDERHLVVADAFGGQLAIVDTQTNKLHSLRSLQAHNIAGLTWDAERQRLLLAHQILLETSPTTEDNILWGAVMKNVVRAIDLAHLLDPQTNLTTQSRVIALGSEGEGSGDPTSIAVLPEGELAVAIGGTNELLRIDAQSFITARVDVGTRPVQVLAVPNSERLVVLNQFDDSLSIIDAKTFTQPRTLSLGPTPRPGPAERGERLFYSARLSYDGWMSCHSCHTGGYTNGLLADTRGDGNFGAPKRTLSLLGTRDTDRWAWTGEVQVLQDQVRKSIESTLHGQTSADEVLDLTTFLHTLDAPPARRPATLDAADRAQVARGKAVFLAQRCDRCHVPSLTYTSQESYDVGLTDALGQKKFNPPSLRGVGQGVAFFHDKRVTSLADVFQWEGHQLDKPLSAEQLADLVRFLDSL
ncbi:MAG TPA: cytochrome c peroxidase [Pirellulaceae bacterium]|nr:cytochrome c peroxidase [Pirellulaceae bacterium]